MSETGIQAVSQEQTRRETGAGGWDPARVAEGAVAWRRLRGPVLTRPAPDGFACLPACHVPRLLSCFRTTFPRGRDTHWPPVLLCTLCWKDRVTRSSCGQDTRGAGGLGPRPH